MSKQQGLEGLIAEWRKAELAHFDGHVMSPETVSDCADELQPFLEILKRLEQAWRETDHEIRSIHEEQTAFADCADQLHALIHGEQPAEEPNGRG